MSLITLNNRALKDATEVGTTTSLGNLVFISRSTASSSSSLSITSGINSTYKEYIFILNSIHPASDNISFQFNGTDDTSSHSFDIAQGTGYHTLSHQASNDNDASLSGFLHLFDPSNTTFVKHFVARISGNNEDNHAQDNLSAGYFNTTAAITGLDFKFSSGNIDSGTIDLYGVN